MIQLTYSLPESLSLFAVCAVSDAFHTNDELGAALHVIYKLSIMA